MANAVLVEVDPRVYIVLRGAGKARRDVIGVKRNELFLWGWRGEKVFHGAFLCTVFIYSISEF
ncbi:hypothetical protein D3C75_1118720 [compost metagenome]